MTELKNIEVFTCLSAQELSVLRANVEFKQVKKGDSISVANGESKAIFYLISSSVVIGDYISQSKKKFTKAIHGPGRFFGLNYLAAGEGPPERIMALENEVKYYQISVDMILRLMGSNQCLAKRLTEVLINSKRKVEKRLMAHQNKSVKSRIVDLLVELAVETGRKISEEVLIRHSLTHGDMSILGNTSRQTVSEVLGKLRTKNIVSYDRKRIIIRNMRKLKLLGQLYIK